jgi:hypothetical protein
VICDRKDKEKDENKKVSGDRLVGGHKNFILHHCLIQCIRSWEGGSGSTLFKMPREDLPSRSMPDMAKPQS